MGSFTLFPHIKSRTENVLCTAFVTFHTLHFHYAVL
ncbi:hypothetical protein BCE_1558 [Bacillus cereus ATCC 10987]|uniref:Uncharacterized protein n=1 Tax=Bacillus cereus (strain ATCC 10987 / NRS 248) TaxID=222523 RepID=Q73B62_BACC1|nr:hypothetical protein BCE_1558 [Bacillus cereus ATCC 10987]